MEVEIISFGNELLNGKTLNTNAHWLAQQITKLGGKLTRITTVSDSISIMTKIISEALERKPKIILTTGGMGTTFDDLALAALAKATNRELYKNQEAIDLIKERLENLKNFNDIELELNENRLRMAMVPVGATVLKNRAGSAPGVMIKENETMIFCMPGVPREMKAIFEFEIVKYFIVDPEDKYFEQAIKIRFIPEAELAEAISSIREKYPRVYIKTHPQSGSSGVEGILVEVHISCNCSEEEGKKLSKIKDELITIISTMKGAKGEKPIIITE
ncbi:MAG: competence damage-inducible protein A [Asgard group archaeon]|nr:competence damage-inducible protein A [Asgard group archaeon]